jgi:ABC-type uncharacterized transport system involved in gliding motility auxiliary subunit
MNKNFLSLGALTAAGVLFLGANILANRGLRGVRMDLTENKLYTLSQGSRNIASKLEEPITLKLYFAREQASTLPPQYGAYFTRVSEMLREFALTSGGKIRLQEIDPKPFSEEEDAANEAQLAAVPTGAGQDRFYFGLVGTNTTGKTETVQFFDPSKEEFLEYDLTKLIYELADPPKKVVGLYANSLPMEGMDQNPMMGRGMPPWQIVAQMREFFDVRKIERENPTIPADVQVLMVVHPKGIDDKALYAIDQFVMRGGRLVVFVDPWCEADLPPGINPMQAVGLPRNSDLKKLFDAWGVEMAAERFAGDTKFAIRLNAGNQNRPELLPFVNYLSLQNEAFNKQDAVTGTMQMVMVGTAGALSKTPDATVTFEPLLQTSTDSMLIETSKVQVQPDAKGMLAGFVKSGSPLTIAARISGTLKSAFPSGPTPTEGQPATPPDGHLTETKQPANVIVVADADMLQDRFWVQPQQFGQVILGYTKFADNGDFVIGALDNLTGSSDLISVRARGKFSRPFDRVEAMRKEAEQKYLAKKQELDERANAAARQLDELLKASNPQGGELILTPEQKAKIEELQKTRIAIRKEQREVNHQLLSDVENLGTKLKVVNIAAMPVAIGVVALGLSFYRVARRRSDRRSSSQG